MPLILPSNSISAGGYEVDNSLRYNQNDDCLIKTFGSGGNRKKFTFSLWIKLSGRGTGNNNGLLIAGTTGNNEGNIKLSNDVIDWSEYNTGTASVIGRLTTSQVFRDYSAWSHLVFVWDSGNATAGNRMRIYHNGSEITSFSDDTNPSLNYDAQINNNVLHNIGRQSWNNSGDYNGYMAEVCFIDGQALDPTSFGEFDEDSGIWKPIDVSGLTFGTNGFYLDFENSGSLGADVSGNGNNFTVNNLTAIDQTTDTCTNNFCTMNPLDNFYANSTFSEGNNKIVTTTGNYTANSATFGLSKGKWYWEVKVTSTSTEDMIGIRGDQTTASTDYLGGSLYDYAYNSYAKLYNNGSSPSYGATFTTGDIIGVALDLDSSTNTITFYKNGSGQGSSNITNVSSTTFGLYFPSLGDFTSGGSATFEINFGNPTFTISSGNTDANGYGNFEYEVPDSYLSLCSANLSEVLG